MYIYEKAFGYIYYAVKAIRLYMSVCFLITEDFVSLLAGGKYDG